MIVFFEDSGKSLIVFSEKSCGNPKGIREEGEDLQGNPLLAFQKNHK